MTLAMKTVVRYTEAMSDKKHKKLLPKLDKSDFQPTKMSLMVATLAVLSLLILALIAVLF